MVAASVAGHRFRRNRHTLAHCGDTPQVRRHDRLDARLPGHRARALVGAALLIAALFVAGRFFVGSGTATVERPQPAAGEIEAAATPRLVVHVVGAVGALGSTDSCTALGSRTRSVAPVEPLSEPT
jgi:hypothetical protein